MTLDFDRSEPALGVVSQLGDLVGTYKWDWGC